MGKTGKKQADEHLQEVRNKNRNGVRFLKRKQQEDDAEKELKNYEYRTPDSNPD